MNSELYQIDEKELVKKDSIIENQHEQILNRDTVISYKDIIIQQHKLELISLDKQLKQEHQLKIKYQKQASTIPYWLGGGGVLGFILCLLLVK